ncbi:ATP-binding protein [sulfur-oxidizing endosymbiont of Gigantopelta aegis]|uniref:ATP-binding protein n=1 Tax=sulfur-oxidizing endosymbiont of Gigantopelta aegis TaxID=2794934 RepID=UPI0018DBB4AC|nr:ATP-binding protein [sulfur-oxidizing endosymbiont of Gigantopelta aegis]
MKKLPIAITTFADIRDPEQNYLYVDKTATALRLADRGRYYFLSRPRRFGKSLFLDTLSDLFQGNKALFEGLAAYEQWDWSVSYPVISISLNSGDFSSKLQIQKRIINILKNNLKYHQVECDDTQDIPGCFSQTIQSIYEKHQQKVVILIDEYDKPILDNIANREQAKVAREVLKTFYSVIKDNDRYIKFVFIAGVSKFSKMNLFSGLNNLTDITTMTDYADICGYTQHDIETTFAEHLQDVDLDKLKQWYNGYDYLAGDEKRVYNPYDILLFINNGCHYENYWWETGNPSFLIEKLKEQNYYIPNLENIIVSKEILNTFDIEKIDLVALLWQTGYLTFANKVLTYDEAYDYQLKVPNREIQKSLNQLFINYLTDQSLEVRPQQQQIYQAISDDITQLESTLSALFAAIPYNNYANKIIERYEGYYASVVFTYLMSLGFPCVAEDVTHKGRIDLTIKLPHRIVIIEFKVDQQETALAQIKTKRYWEKYLIEAKTQQQEIVLVGICFSSANKNITEFEVEQVDISI